MHKVVQALTVIVGVFAFRQASQVRCRIGSLLASLFLPFVWMIGYNVPFGHASGLAICIPIGPVILPAELIRGLVEDVKVEDITRSRVLAE